LVDFPSVGCRPPLACSAFSSSREQLALSAYKPAPARQDATGTRLMAAKGYEPAQKEGHGFRLIVKLRGGNKRFY